jgi:hypothetical protein
MVIKQYIENSEEVTKMREAGGNANIRVSSFNVVFLI